MYYNIVDEILSIKLITITYLVKKIVRKKKCAN